MLSLDICLRGGPNQKRKLVFSILPCETQKEKVHQRDELKATNTSSLVEVPWSGKITSGWGYLQKSLCSKKTYIKMAFKGKYFFLRSSPTSNMKTCLGTCSNYTPYFVYSTITTSCRQKPSKAFTHCAQISNIDMLSLFKRTPFLGKRRTHFI